MIIYFNEVLEGDDRSAGGDRNLVKYLNQAPTEACTFFGKNAVSGEDGFGMQYKYDLSFQGNVLI